MDGDPDLDRRDPADRELMAFLADERAMQSFLFRLREQYHQGSAVWGADESEWRRRACLLPTVRSCGLSPAETSGKRLTFHAGRGLMDSQATLAPTGHVSAWKACPAPKRRCVLP